MGLVRVGGGWWGLVGLVGLVGVGEGWWGSVGQLMETPTGWILFLWVFVESVVFVD